MTSAPAKPATASAASQASAPMLKPRCALKVAVVGNRRFGGETDESPTEAATTMKRRAAHAFSALWTVLVETMPSALAMEVPVPVEHQRTDDRLERELRLKDFYSDETPRLALLSALAAGADQIAAEAALTPWMTTRGAQTWPTRCATCSPCRRSCRSPAKAGTTARSG